MCSVCTYISYIYLYIYIYHTPAPLPFPFYPLSYEISFLFVSFTLRRFIVSNYYYYCLTNVRIERERQSDVFIWWGVFLCWIFYVPLRRCYLLRSALCIRFEHCVHTDTFFTPQHIQISRNIVIVLTYFRERAKYIWECAIEYVIFKLSRRICTSKYGCECGVPV